MPSASASVATMLGLALAIDYSLFLVRRFREELRERYVPKLIDDGKAPVKVRRVASERAVKEISAMLELAGLPEVVHEERLAVLVDVGGQRIHPGVQ